MNVHAEVRQIMGLPQSIHVHADPATDRNTIAATVEEAYRVLTLFDDVFSLWKPDSDLGRLVTGRAELSDLHPLLTESLAIAYESVDVTRGAFNPFMTMTSPWRGYDPTGFVKGWAAAEAGKVLSRLEERGCSWVVNSGGDIACGGGSWVIGIENAEDPTRIIGSVELSAGALATSGTYARGAHLLDPATGAPATATGSVTVSGPDLLWADIWATALFVGGSVCDMSAWDDRYVLLADQRAGSLLTASCEFVG